MKLSASTKLRLHIGSHCVQRTFLNDSKKVSFCFSKIMRWILSSRIFFLFCEASAVNEATLCFATSIALSSFGSGQCSRGSLAFFLCVYDGDIIAIRTRLVSVPHSQSCVAGDSTDSIPKLIFHDITSQTIEWISAVDVWGVGGIDVRSIFPTTILAKTAIGATWREDKFHFGFFV